MKKGDANSGISCGRLYAPTGSALTLTPYLHRAPQSLHGWNSRPIWCLKSDVDEGVWLHPDIRSKFRCRTSEKASSIGCTQLLKLRLRDHASRTLSCAIDQMHRMLFEYKMQVPLLYRSFTINMAAPIIGEVNSDGRPTSVSLTGRVID